MKSKCILLALILAMVFFSPSATAQVEATYTERYRPQYHFTPAVNWMNDPNGLVYFDGEYHLFYQYNPFGDTWGHMSWGHAVSRDLVHWEELPVALPEEDGVMIFSGSAVVDWHDTSGFGADGRPPLVAVYTGHHTTGERQDQRIAYSTDRGRTWTKYAGNPVLDRGLKDFRDPKVFWYEPDEKWVMVVALSTERKVQFYASDDLKAWSHLSDFGPAGAVEGIWECPDLFELRVDGDADHTRWVLQVDLNPGAVAGGSGGQYFIGHFDGEIFTTDTPVAGEHARWVDYGADFYAAQSWSDVPEADGKRLWIAWMNDWRYAGEIPTAPWRSAQSLPRRVTLRTLDGVVQLVQRPAHGPETLRRTQHRLAGVDVGEGTSVLQEIEGQALELMAEFEAGEAGVFGLKVRTGHDEETIVGYDVAAEHVFVDRGRSGKVDFHPDFAARHAGPLPAENGRVRLHVFVDWSSVEVFAGNGRTVITDRIFPDPESRGVALFAEGGTARLVSLDVWQLASAVRGADR